MKRKIFILLAVVVALVAGLIVQQERAYQRATYRGRHARAWAEELYPNFDPLSTKIEMTAFRVMGSNAVPALRSMLKTREPFYAKAIVQNAKSIPITTRRYLFEKIKPGQSIGRRIAAAHALEVIGPGAVDAVPDLIVALQDDPEVRWAAAQALACIGGEGIRALAGAATNGNLVVRHAAVYGLGRAGTNALPATAVLLHCVLDTSESVQASALYSLRRVGPVGVPVVLEAFSTDDPARREAAIKAIKAMNTPPQQVLRTLLDYSTNSTPDLRRHSLEALHALRLNHPRVVAACVRALNDSDPGVRVAAARAMNQADIWATNRALGEVTVRMLNLNGTLESNIVSALNVLLEDPDLSVRTAAQQTLANLQASTTN